MNRLVSIFALAIVLAAGCEREFRRAIRLAEASKAVHDDVAQIVAQETVRLVEKSRAGGLTDDELKLLRLLERFRVNMDRFSTLHNSYISALKVWRATGEQPAELAEIAPALIQFFKDASEINKALKARSMTP